MTESRGPSSGDDEKTLRDRQTAIEDRMAELEAAKIRREVGGIIKDDAKLDDDVPLTPSEARESFSRKAKDDAESKKQEDELNALREEHGKIIRALDGKGVADPGAPAADAGIPKADAGAPAADPAADPVAPAASAAPAADPVAPAASATPAADSATPAADPATPAADPATPTTGSTASSPEQTANDEAEAKRRVTEKENWEKTERERIAYANKSADEDRLHRRWVLVGGGTQDNDDPESGLSDAGLKGKWRDGDLKRAPGVYTRDPEGSSDLKFKVDENQTYTPIPPSKEGYSEMMDAMKHDGIRTVQIDWPSTKDITAHKLLELTDMANSKGMGVMHGPNVKAFLNDPKSKVWSGELQARMDKDPLFKEYLEVTGKNVNISSGSMIKDAFKSKEDGPVTNKEDAARQYLRFLCRNVDDVKQELHGMKQLTNPKTGKTYEQTEQFGMQAYLQKADYLHITKGLNQNVQLDKKEEYKSSLEKEPGMMGKEIRTIKGRMDTLSEIATRIDRNVGDEKRLYEAAINSKNADGTEKSPEKMAEEVIALKYLESRLDLTREPREILLGAVEKEMGDLKSRLEVCETVLTEKADSSPDAKKQMESVKELKETLDSSSPDKPGLSQKLDGSKKDFNKLSKEELVDSVDQIKSWQELETAKRTPS